MRTDFFLTIIVAVVLLAGMCWPSEAVARGGCSSCAAGSCQAEAPVQYAAPMAPSVCQSCPARAVAKAAVTVAKAPIVAVEQRRERTIERRFYRGRWVPGLWFRLGRM